MELTLDGERAADVHVCTPNRNQIGDLLRRRSRRQGPEHVRIRVSAGPHDVGVTFPRRPSRWRKRSGSRTSAHFNMDRHPRLQLALYSVSIAGPFDAGAADRHAQPRRIFVCHRRTPRRRRLRETDRVARWRAARSAEPSPPPTSRRRMRFYKEARAEGGFEAGIEMALRAVLASTEFLFRIEQRSGEGVAPQTPYRISDVELASRLSFFLWSSIPDDELLDVAVAGRLTSPAVLEQQVRRMLADPRADALVTNFAGQWLYLRNLAAREPGRAGCSRTSTTTCVRPSGARRSCSSRASCARTAACSICCARTTRSSTSGWRSTTAFPTCTAAASGA